MTATFGDADPEDQYDDGDPIGERLAILERVVESIDAEGDTPRRPGRILDALRLVFKVAAELGDYDARLTEVRDVLEEMVD